MDCPSIKELLSPYLDGELSSLERARVDDHVSTCKECRVLLFDLQDTSRTVGQTLQAIPLPVDLEERILVRLANVREGTHMLRLSFVFITCVALCASLSALLILSPVGLFVRALFRLGVGVLRGLVLFSSAAGWLWLSLLVIFCVLLAGSSLVGLSRMLRPSKSEVLL